MLCVEINKNRVYNERMYAFLFGLGSAWITSIVLPISIACVCLLGDKLLEKLHNEVARALTDSLTHGCIGVLTWLIIDDKLIFLERFAKALACGVLASGIDVDHFVAAKSFSIKDAMHLDHRPFLHCTTLILGVWSMLLCMGYYYKSRFIEQLAWMVVAAGVSHHIRDGTRRGLWFCPFGSTRPIPYKLYIGSLMLFPFLCRVLMKQTMLSRKETKTHILIDL